MKNFAAFAAFSALVVGTAGALTGCVGRSASSPKSEAKTKPEKPKATPLPIAVNVHGGMDATIFDLKGAIVATVKAASTNVGPDGANVSDPIGAAKNASAVLYQAGKPTATFQAATLHADQNAGKVIGVGGVTLRSLTEPGSPAIRADTMTWIHGENRVVGQGNVFIARQADPRFPATHLTGTHFTADTAIRRYVLYDVGTLTNANAAIATPSAAPTSAPTERPVASGNF